MPIFFKKNELIVTERNGLTYPQEIVIERNHSVLNGGGASGSSADKNKPEVPTYRVVEKTTTFTTQVKPEPLCRDCVTRCCNKKWSNFSQSCSKQSHSSFYLKRTFSNCPKKVMKARFIPSGVLFHLY